MRVIIKTSSGCRQVRAASTLAACKQAMASGEAEVLAYGVNSKRALQGRKTEKGFTITGWLKLHV